MKAPGVGDARFRTATVAVLPVVALLVFSAAAWAQDGTRSADGARASEGQIGVYVISLHDFDTVDDSFGADFWLWSIHPPGDNPLEGVEFVNAEQLRTRLEETTGRGDREWSRLKARTTVLHDWDVSNFPFDRQTLTVDLGIVGAGGRAYGVDRAGSGYGGHVAPEGWRVTDFEVERRAVTLDTDFGDPTASGDSTQEHLFVRVGVERESVVGFFKLVAGVYAAFAIALLSFLMAPEQFAGRMTVLVGALFATVINLQVSDNVLGSLDKVSLVAEIHIVALVYVFAAALMSIASDRSYHSGHGDRARRRDLISLGVFSGSFVVVNLVLILQAAASG